MGGVSGLIYSSLPVLVFVPISSLFGLTPAIIAALAVAALILVWRLVRRESTQPAISGFMGVGICALIAYLMGESKGYFLLGIWSSLFWAAVFGLSVLIRRPVVGYIWGWVNGHDRAWRSVRRAVLAFDIATITWVLVFAVALRRAASSVRRRPDRMAWRRPHRDGMAADRRGGAGHLSGHPVGPAGPARPRPGRGRSRRRGRGAGNLVDRNARAPAARRRNPGVVRGVLGRFGGQPRAARDQPRFRRRAGAAAVGRGRLPARPRRADPRRGRDLRRASDGWSC